MSKTNLHGTVRFRAAGFEQLEDRRLMAGLTAAGNQVVHHGLPEIPDGNVPTIEGVAAFADQFGNVLATGDFNGDTFPDLAIGASKNLLDPDNHDEGEDAVNVLYGSSSGLTTAGNQRFDQDAAGMADFKEEGDRFGQALAAGDLNNDGYDDLVIGVPGENASAGALHILLGSETGLAAEGSLYRNSNGAGELYGHALAIGDMDHDGIDDLAVGQPGINNEQGQITVMFAGFSVGMGGFAESFRQFGGGSGPEDGDRFGFTLDMGDFDRDGFDDLVVGVPHEDHEGLVFDQVDAGAVNIFRGGPNGLADDGHQFWDQDSSGINDSPGASNEFGFAVTVGDFNGDLVDDLAIGVPGETENGQTLAGAVNIIYGEFGSGLTSQGNEYIHQDTSLVADTPELGDRFGASLAAGDFNGDLRDDLIVGVPQEDSDDHDVGAIHIFPGSASGLTPSADVKITFEDAAGTNGGSTIDAFFGAALAVADFDQDGKADIAAGTPGKTAKRGIVHTIYGTDGSFEFSNNQIWQQGSGGSDNELQAFADFGTSVAAGDFDGDGHSDMATGIPFRHLPTEQRWIKLRAGAVNVVYGDAAGLDTDTAEIWTQDRLRHPNTDDSARGAEGTDEFGTALATGDFNNDGFDDLAIGSPGESLDGKSNVGMVNVVFGSANGLTAAIDLTDTFAARNQFLWQGDGGVVDSADEFDQFGRALTVGDFDNDGYDDLAVGVPGEEDSTAQPGRDAGAVHIFYGGESGFINGIDGLIRDELWTVTSANIDVLMREEEFGTSLAADDFDGDGVDDLAIGAPDSVPIFPLANEGFVGVMYGSQVNGLSATGNHGLFGFASLFNPQEQFGFSLAAGDINGDGRADLAVGAPFDDFPGFFPLPDLNNAGSVNVYYGDDSGLLHNTFDVWTQSNNGGATSAIGSAGAGDQFGYALTIGDFDGDTFGDLVIGVPETGTSSQFGEANLIHGSASGLNATRQQVWRQDSPGILDSPETGDRFANSLAVGDFNRDGAADLLVGVRSEDLGDVTNAGLVHAIFADPDFMLGDFDGNGLLDGDDIDGLSAAAAAGTHLAQFDLTGDGLVTVADVHYWVTELKGTLLADTNLDFVVDGQDFIVWNTHKFTADSRWTHGDFNADGVIDGVDFVTWNEHKFTSADALPVLDPDQEEQRQQQRFDLIDQLLAIWP